MTTSGVPAWTRPTEKVLTAVAAVIIAVTAASFAPAAFDDAASAKFQGAVAVLALGFLATLASIFVGAHSDAGAFMLRASAGVLLSAMGNIIGSWAPPVLVMAQVLLLASVILLVSRMMDRDDKRGVSHLE